MYEGFKYDSIALKDILLDDMNPRLVTQKKLSSQDEIIKYLFDYEDLAVFIKKIASEGRNYGAERPYVIKIGSNYKVIEGNTRIAAYKLLAGISQKPNSVSYSIPHISAGLKKNLLTLECTIAPNRDALLPIMANAHFGLGEKSKWGYLGSRKAVFDEWKSGKSVANLAKAFDRTQAQIRALIIEYSLYLKAISLKWTQDEKVSLLNPGVEFNPPVRFLQTSGHRDKVGIKFDNANLKVVFNEKEAEKKFKHLIKKLVVNPSPGLGATASYEQVFKDYAGTKPPKSAISKMSLEQSKSSTKSGAGTTSDARKANTSQLKPGALFAYPMKLNNALIAQLLKEAKDINSKGFPACATFLLRNIVEAVLKEIINQQKANAASTVLDLERAINLCLSNGVSLPRDDKNILSEFKKSYLSYLNLGAHATVIPNTEMVLGARDCIDQFIKRNI